MTKELKEDKAEKTESITRFSLLERYQSEDRAEIQELLSQ